MNISDKGNVCIDILKQNWSPALSLFKVMLSLSSLLTDPNPRKSHYFYFQSYSFHYTFCTCCGPTCFRLMCLFRLTNALCS